MFNPKCIFSTPFSRTAFFHSSFMIHIFSYTWGFFWSFLRTYSSNTHMHLAMCTHASTPERTGCVWVPFLRPPRANMKIYQTYQVARVERSKLTQAYLFISQPKWQIWNLSMDSMPQKKLAYNSFIYTRLSDYLGICSISLSHPIPHFFPLISSSSTPQPLPLAHEVAVFPASLKSSTPGSGWMIQDACPFHNSASPTVGRLLPSGRLSERGQGTRLALCAVAEQGQLIVWNKR